VKRKVRGGGYSGEGGNNQWARMSVIDMVPARGRTGRASCMLRACSQPCRSKLATSATPEVLRVERIGLGTAYVAMRSRLSHNQLTKAGVLAHATGAVVLISEEGRQKNQGHHGEKQGSKLPQRGSGHRRSVYQKTPRFGISRIQLTEGDRAG
jgi:hypothetical protein